MRDTPLLNTTSSTANNPTKLDTSHVHLLYAGGTFGSYGNPLSVLPATLFEPLLIDFIKQHSQVEVTPLDNPCIKDSSHLTPRDFVHFYQLILSNYSQHHKRFIVITGTDTMSYLGAFLAEAFAGSDICIILTGSMKPLIDANNITDYVVDNQSDAWGNLNDALGIAGYGEAGVYVAFGGEVWPAQTVQKIHSHDLMAFTGHSRAGYPANSYIKSMVEARRDHWISDRNSKLADVVSSASTAVIPTIYCVPNDPIWFAQQLENIGQLPATGSILIGFGAGNFPYSERVVKAMHALYKKGHLLVSTTQSPYGGVSDSYAAGSWQYDHHVLSGGRLTIAAIYARLLWLHLTYDTPSRRRQRWRYSVNKTDIGLVK